MEMWWLIDELRWLIDELRWLIDGDEVAKEIPHIKEKL